MKNVIILNGPPRSGKDFIANALTKRNPVTKGIPPVKMQMKDHLIKIATLLACIPMQDWSLRYEAEESPNVWYKDIPWDRLPKNPMTGYNKHFSQRSFLIYVSEVMLKQSFGSNYFGIAAAKAVEQSSSGIVFSDGGFRDEVAEISKVVDRILLIHLYREGTSWGSDSRHYINMKDDPKVRTVRIQNKGSIEPMLKPLKEFLNE